MFPFGDSTDYMNILPVWCLALEILGRHFYFMGFQSVCSLRGTRTDVSVRQYEGF